MKQEIENFTKQLSKINENNAKILAIFGEIKGSDTNASTINKTIEEYSNNSILISTIVTQFIEKMRDQEIIDLAKELKGSKDTNLTIRDMQISDKGMIVLVEELKGSKVTDFRFRDNEISYEGMIAFAKGLRDTNITKLDLMQNEIKDKGMIALLEGLKGTNITEFNIWNKISNEGIITFAKILNDTNITKLQIQANKISNEAMVALAKGLGDSNVTELFFGNNLVSDKGMIALVEALKDSKITKFGMSHQVSDEGMVALAKGLNDSNVTDLNISNNEISDKGIITFAKGLKGSNIKHLDISNNKISDKGIIALAEVLNGSKVTSLNISHNETSDEGFIALAKGLKDSSVTDLNISSNSNRISDEGFIALAKGLKDSSVLSFDFNGIIASDKAMIDAARELEGSKVIEIGCANDISNEVRKAFAESLGNNAKPNIKIVNILLKYVTEYVAKDEDEKEESKYDAESNLKLVFDFEKLGTNEEELNSLLEFIDKVLNDSIELWCITKFIGHSCLHQRQISEFCNDKAALLDVKGKIVGLLPNSSSSVAQQEELSELAGMMISDEQHIQFNQQEVEAQVMGDSSEQQNQGI